MPTGNSLPQCPQRCRPPSEVAISAFRALSRLQFFCAKRNHLDTKGTAPVWEMGHLRRALEKGVSSPPGKAGSVRYWRATRAEPVSETGPQKGEHNRP